MSAVASVLRLTFGPNSCTNAVAELSVSMPASLMVVTDTEQAEESLCSCQLTPVRERSKVSRLDGHVYVVRHRSTVQRHADEQQSNAIELQTNAND